MSLNGVSLAYMDASEESDLIEAAQTGDRYAYLRLVRHYDRPLYRAVYAVARDPEKVETLTRDVFVRAWQRIHDFPRGQRFFPWLLRTARVLLPAPQAQAGVDPSGADAPGTDAPDAPASAPPGSASGGVTPEAAALAAFVELRPDEQMVLSLRLLEEITYEEIGGILDLTLGVVTLRLSQARGHLLPRAEAFPAEES